MIPPILSLLGYFKLLIYASAAQGERSGLCANGDPNGARRRGSVGERSRKEAE